MQSETLNYDFDGLTMRSTLYGSGRAGQPAPAVLVFPEAFGLGAHAKEKARRIAELGYVALACDLHGDERVLESMAELQAALAPLFADSGKIRGLAAAHQSVLAARPEVDATRMAAIGYCFGGTMALEMARAGAPIKAAVGFHSGLQTLAPATSGAVGAKVLVCLGADDPIIQPEQRRAFEAEMAAAGADWQMHLYGGVTHSFTNPEADARNQPASFRYSASADARSWASLVAMLGEAFG